MQRLHRWPTALVSRANYRSFYNDKIIILLSHLDKTLISIEPPSSRGLKLPLEQLCFASTGRLLLLNVTLRQVLFELHKAVL